LTQLTSLAVSVISRRLRATARSPPLDIATGQVTGACKPGIGTTVHKHLNVKKWLGNNPRIVVHCAPTHAS